MAGRLGNKIRERRAEREYARAMEEKQREEDRLVEQEEYDNVARSLDADEYAQRKEIENIGNELKNNNAYWGRIAENRGRAADASEFNSRPLSDRMAAIEDAKAGIDEKVRSGIPTLQARLTDAALQQIVSDGVSADDEAYLNAKQEEYDADDDRTGAQLALGDIAEEKAVEDEKRQNGYEAAIGMREDKDLRSAGGSHREKVFESQRMNNEVGNIVDNLYGIYPAVEAFKKAYDKPQAPVYDPRREKALQWQKAIVSLGKLAGVINDVRTVNSNGIVNEKPQGEKEISVIDANIKSLRDTFAKQYDDYLEADKLYKKELYAAYRHDIDNRVALEKTLIPQYQKQNGNSIRWSLMTPNDRAIRAAGKGSSDLQKGVMRLTIYGNDNNGVPNNILINKNEYQQIVGDAVASLMNDNAALNSMFNHFVKMGEYDKDGFDPNDVSTTVSLFSEPDKTKAREHFLSMIKKYPQIALSWAQNTGNKTFLRDMEGKLGMVQGTLSMNGQDRDFLIRSIIEYDGPEDKMASANLAEYYRYNVDNDTLIKIYQDLYGRPFVPDKTRHIYEPSDNAIWTDDGIGGTNNSNGGSGDGGATQQPQQKSDIEVDLGGGRKEKVTVDLGGKTISSADGKQIGTIGDDGKVRAANNAVVGEVRNGKFMPNGAFARLFE